MSKCRRISSCSFYAHCIEPAFHCGAQGFTFSYAKERCQNIRKLKLNSTRCTGQYCVSEEARSWARKTETCLRSKMETLLQRYPGDAYPDPQTCLSWEMDALAELKQCYYEERKTLRQLSQTEIVKLIDLFRVSDYYGPVVEQGLLLLLDSSNPDLVSQHTRNHSLSFHHRILICIRASKYTPRGELTDANPEDYVLAVRDTLAQDKDEDYFHYGGPDHLEGNVGDLCYNRAIVKNHGRNNFAKTEFHVVTWFTTDESLDDISYREVELRYVEEGLYINFALFELTTTEDPPDETGFIREVTQCGDGIRQVSELCDFAGAYPGCTLDCTVRTDHDCSSQKLVPSVCWREVCGDGLRTRGEECDDGNNSNTTDGCDSSCRLNNTHTCSRHYNATSLCVALQIKPQQAPAKLTAETAAENLPSLLRGVLSADRTLPAVPMVANAGQRVAGLHLPLLLLVSAVHAVVGALR